MMKSKIFWFMGGFGIGLTLLSLGHASLQGSNAALTEIKEGKVTAPDLDHDFAKLSALESGYSESSAQQDRLKTATSRAARSGRTKKARQ